MPINNLAYFDAYNINVNYNKADLFKSKKIKLAKLNQLNK